MAKKSDYSLVINFFFNSLKIGSFIVFRPSIFTIPFFGSLFTIHYKKGHYSLIIIPHPDPLKYQYIVMIYRHFIIMCRYIVICQYIVIIDIEKAAFHFLVSVLFCFCSQRYNIYHVICIYRVMRKFFVQA